MTESLNDAARRLAGARKVVAVHAYNSAAGELIYGRVRALDANGEKWIRPFHRNGSGFVFGEPAFPPEGKPLYNLDTLAANPSAPVWFVEGEKTADALVRLGVIATTSGGATSDSSADFAPLARRVVTLWPDHDAAGGEHMQRVAAKLAALGCDVSIVDAGALGLPEHGDAVDWIAGNPQARPSDLAHLPRTTFVETKRGRDAPAQRILHRCVADIFPQPIRWLWYGRIARGKIIVIAGHPGLGKSQVTTSMAAIVSTGGVWPVDRSRCERGSVVIVSAEDDAEDTIRPRLEAAGADLTRVHIVDCVADGFRADGGEHRRGFRLDIDIDRLGALMQRIGDVALVVIDPITAFLGDADSHKNAEVRALLAPLAEAAARHGAAVVCVSHLTKNGDADALMRVMGSLAFVAAARAAYVVARDRDNETRRLFLPLKNNLGVDRSGLAFCVEGATIKSGIETSRVIWEAEPVNVTADEAMAPQLHGEERGALDDAKLFLQGLLADGSVRTKQIRMDADGAGYAWATIRRAQQALGVEAVKLGMREGWVWRLPPKMLNGDEDA